MGANTETSKDAQKLCLSLIGPFGLTAGDGSRIAISSKRGQALLALLAASDNHDRSRSWLQSILWCDRSAEQAKASLRKELSNLKKLVNAHGVEALKADTTRIWLEPDAIEWDFHGPKSGAKQDFLEGLDIPGEDAFEDWLREYRAHLRSPSPRTAQDAEGDTEIVEAAGHAPALAAAIAVLPLRLELAQPDLQFAVLGVGEEIINRLARLKWLPVIARGSSFSLGDTIIDPRAAGAALGARYIVEGSVRAFGSSYRLHASLTDAEDGKSLWSDTVNLDNLGDPQAIAVPLNGVAAALDHTIDKNEQMRAMAKRGDNLDVMELVWKAKYHMIRLTADDISEAQNLLDAAAELAPNSSEVLIEQAWLNIRRLWLKRGSDDEVRAARKAAQKAIFADPDDARGHMIAGIAEFWLHQPLRAEGLLRRAIELNPSLVMAHAQLGSALHHKGDRAEAIEALETAKRLSPNDADLFFAEGELAMAHLAEGNLETAIEHAEASLSRRAAYWAAHIAKINALVGLERLKEARTASDELYAVHPGFSPEYVNWLPYVDVSRNDALRAGLNRAARPND